MAKNDSLQEGKQLSLFGNIKGAPQAGSKEPKDPGKCPEKESGGNISAGE